MLGRAIVHAGDLLAPLLKDALLLFPVAPEIHGVIDDAAERVDGVDRLALGARQAQKRVEEIRAALPREAGNELACVHVVRPATLGSTSHGCSPGSGRRSEGGRGA